MPAASPQVGIGGDMAVSMRELRGIANAPTITQSLPPNGSMSLPGANGKCITVASVPESTASASTRR